MKPSHLSAVLVLTLLAACGDDAAPCVSRSDCEDLEVCVNGSCVFAPVDGGARDSTTADGNSADGVLATDAGTLDTSTTTDTGPTTDAARLDAPMTSDTSPIADAGTDAAPDARINAESVAACEPHQHALYFEGTGFIFTGTQLITGAEAAFRLSGLGGSGGGVEVSVVPTVPGLGSSWTADFAAPSPPLEVQVYPMATRYPFNSRGEPGMAVSGDGRGCNQINGSFEVHRLERDSEGRAASVLISFEQFCLDTGGGVLRGCAKYSL